MAFIEVVSLWLVLVIVIGIPGLLAAKDFFLWSLKKELNMYDMTSHIIYYFPFPIYSQKNLDAAAVYRDAGQIWLSDGL